MRGKECLVIACIAMLVAACGTTPQRPPAERAAVPPGLTLPKPAPSAKGGGYYQDDGPADSMPANLDAIPDAQPRAEPLHRFANRPYSVLGQDFVPYQELKPYKARGIGSWYGRKFHGQKTSIGEPYDMFAMTAAHPTLPLPSYARVTNLANGKSVVVRVNDRGPFLHGRVIDLSYAAAWKLGYVSAGSAQVEVESVLPGEAPKDAPSGGTLLASAPLAPPPATEGQGGGSPDPIAEAVSAAPVEAPSLPLAQELRGTFLQLGAFGSQENAESFRARLLKQLDWVRETIHIHARDGMYRLHLGPYGDTREAGRVAEKIREALALRPFIVQR
ncbi:MAG: septal ring lytic transglycosylase RlpA family protein [Rhodocyclaceae bacterium]|nr:septal ring lytic transglycosylase RlpA family protein [Rhodocyclaceae bacterium]